MTFPLTFEWKNIVTSTECTSNDTGFKLSSISYCDEILISVVVNSSLFSVFSLWSQLKNRVGLVHLEILLIYISNVEKKDLFLSVMTLCWWHYAKSFPLSRKKYTWCHQGSNLQSYKLSENLTREQWKIQYTQRHLFPVRSSNFV